MAVTRIPLFHTIADGLAAPWTEEFNLQLIRRYVDDVVLVSDRELAQSLSGSWSGPSC